MLWWRSAELLLASISEVRGYAASSRILGASIVRVGGVSHRLLVVKRVVEPSTATRGLEAAPAHVRRTLIAHIANIRASSHVRRVLRSQRIRVLRDGGSSYMRTVVIGETTKGHTLLGSSRGRSSAASRRLRDRRR